MKMLCQKCNGKNMQRRKATHERPYHYTESGLETVFLAGITVYQCAGCAEEVPEIPNIAQLHDGIALTLVRKPALLSGADIRFLRKNLRLKATDFAAFLDTTPVSVSRWETGEQPVSKENDKLIRYFYLRYKEEMTNRRIQGLVAQLGHVEQEPKALVMNVKVRPRGTMSTEFVESAAAR